MALIAALSGSERLSPPGVSSRASWATAATSDRMDRGTEFSRRDDCRRRLVCAGREVKARLLPMRIVAALNARLMGRLYRIFSFVLLTNSWRQPTLLSVDAWIVVHCTGRMGKVRQLARACQRSSLNVKAAGSAGLIVDVEHQKQWLAGSPCVCTAGSGPIARGNRHAIGLRGCALADPGTSGWRRAVGRSKRVAHQGDAGLFL